VGASRALDVAKEHGLPASVLRRAEQYLLISGEDSSALIDRLNALAVEREGELAALAKERAAFADKKKRLEERFEAERLRLFESIRTEAQSVLKDWKKSKITHKQALKELAKIRSAVAAPQEETQSAREPLDLGALSIRQRVRHIPWKRVGVLLEVDERKKRLRLDFDGVSLWADAKDVEAVEGAPGNTLHATGHSSAAHVPSAALALRLDLRGMRADVALSEVESFLDRAILAGRQEVEIIHGRGTGALRREVQAFLRQYPAARGFRLAPEDMGGDGVTLVELK